LLAIASKPRTKSRRGACLLPTRPIDPHGQLRTDGHIHHGYQGFSEARLRTRTESLFITSRPWRGRHAVVTGDSVRLGEAGWGHILRRLGQILGHRFQAWLSSTVSGHVRSKRRHARVRATRCPERLQDAVSDARRQPSATGWARRRPAIASRASATSAGRLAYRAATRSDERYRTISLFPHAASAAPSARNRRPLRGQGSSRRVRVAVGVCWLVVVVIVPRTFACTPVPPVMASVLV
jgi:hypothetical protein